MSDISLRRLTLRDAQSVWKTELRCFSDPWSIDAVRETLEDVNAFSVGAYDESDNLLGFAIAYAAADEADIADIAVDPHRRREGIGKALLSALLGIAAERGATYAYLEVRLSNAPAISMYTAMGFESVGVRKNYYRSPAEDAVVMRTEISHLQKNI